MEVEECMTKDEIIEMAKEAGWPDSLVAPIIMAKLNDFAKVVAKHEREACAVIANSMDSCQDGEIGKAIRARGEA